MPSDNSKVGGSMTKQVVYVSPDDKLQLAHQLMRSHGFRHLPVVEDNRRLVAVLSDRDVLLCSLPGEDGLPKVPDVAVSEAMTRNPITCRESSTIRDVAQAIVDRKIDCLPVVDDRHKLVGMITTTDLVSLLIDDDDREAAKKPIPFRFNLQPAEAMAANA